MCKVDAVLLHVRDRMLKDHLHGLEMSRIHADLLVGDRRTEDQRDAASQKPLTLSSLSSRERVDDGLMNLMQKETDGRHADCVDLTTHNYGVNWDSCILIG
jgi:hypothetical protein